jgi:hypothetical protein
MLSPHGQGKGPWILLHVVSGPWTSFVAALDKGQCRKAVCRRHNTLYHHAAAPAKEINGILITDLMCASIAARLDILRSLKAQLDKRIQYQRETARVGGYPRVLAFKPNL